MLVFRITKTPIRSLFEPKSPLPGNGIFRPETNGPKKAPELKAWRSGDKTYSQNPANSGLIAGFGEISLERECVVGLRGLELRAKHAVAIEPVSRE